VAVLTSVELDHADAFGSLAQLREVFRAFLAGAPQAVVWDRPDLLALRVGPVVAYDAPDVQLHGGRSSFGWRGHEVRLAVPGAHNAIDAAGALEAARLAGAGESEAVAALATFGGAGRRFQLLGTSAAGASVYDDYAHHPTEVAATLRGARPLVSAGGRLVAVFQPHLFSRTRALAREFGQALALADLAVVLDVYPARERAEDHPGITGLTVAECVSEAARGRQVFWLPTFDLAEAVLTTLLAAGDVCVVMGAGDIDSLGRRLVVAADAAPAGAGLATGRA
jgi:UDP-N-acetylmuramate--alanine ligase